VSSNSTTAGISLATTTADVATSGTGAINLTSTRDVSLSSGASLVSVNGGITVNANAGGVSGNFSGLQIAYRNLLLDIGGTEEKQGVHNSMRDLVYKELAARIEFPIDILKTVLFAGPKEEGYAAWIDAVLSSGVRR